MPKSKVFVPFVHQFFCLTKLKQFSLLIAIVTIKNPLDALSTLRLGHNFFHLVITYVHMPNMNGFEFQKRVQEEFHLPIVVSI